MSDQKPFGVERQLLQQRMSELFGEAGYLHERIGQLAGVAEQEDWDEQRFGFETGDLRQRLGVIRDEVSRLQVRLAELE